MEANLINLFRQFKLGNSLFTDSHRVSSVEAEYFKSSAIDYEKIRISEQGRRLSEFILSHQASATKKIEHEDGSIEYRIQLLVLKMDEFKTIVEAAIQMIPDEKIKEIKQGGLYNHV